MFKAVKHFSFWRRATILPPRNCLLHDLVYHVFLRNLQYGIVVPGFLDSFVYAHHKHRLDSANHGNFGDCLARRVRFRTAITPAYAHTYQTICLGMYFPGVSHHPFRFHTDPSSDILFFPMIVLFPNNLAMIIVGLLFIRWWYPCCGW